ncbi:type II CAAX prenyl endopeptidase Rce1 family protein [Microcoleus sp. BROC3]|uniref:type II CAAX prenyl endopeptidase Rce1 family protein n=1 Tax=Microcoleus sp. BROC3 TaxID=3055323 RepID=UPI002FD7330D
MTLTNISSPEDNPFFLIKVRHIFGWYFLLGIGIYFQMGMIGYTRGIPFDGKTPLDPFVDKIAETYLMILLLALVWRQCRLAGIEIKYLVGKVPDRYQWLPLVCLAIASVVFGVGVFRIFYYPLSFIVPSFVEKILTDNRNTGILITASKSFSPALYYLIFPIYAYVISPLVNASLFISILLHRWAGKWGNITAIIAMCLLWGTLVYNNFIAMIILTLIFAILYVKTRSLLVLIIFFLIRSLCFTIWDLSYPIFFDNPTRSTLEIFRSQIQLGVLFFALSAPWVIGFIYKNWSVLKGPLPYFANAAEAEKIKADSAT